MAVKTFYQLVFRGLFFNNHLIKIIVNDVPVNFTKLNLNYLLKDQYDGPFLDKIYSIPQLSIDELIKETLKKRESSTSFRVQYSSMHEYTNIARRLNIMIDTKVRFNIDLRINFLFRPVFQGQRIMA
jgi:alpha-1,3-mannosyl-glycoprotein beta-1,2-N-acetylglucosaminyltransferase